MENRHKRVNPEQDALVHIVARRDKPFLEERFIDSFKGMWCIYKTVISVFYIGTRMGDKLQENYATLVAPVNEYGGPIKL